MSKLNGSKHIYVEEGKYPKRKVKNNLNSSIWYRWCWKINFVLGNTSGWLMFESWKDIIYLSVYIPTTTTIYATWLCFHIDDATPNCLHISNQSAIYLPYTARWHCSTTAITTYLFTMFLTPKNCYDHHWAQYLLINKLI